jgi:hypothetical protein
VSAAPATGVCVAGAGPAGLVLVLVLRDAQIPCVYAGVDPDSGQTGFVHARLPVASGTVSRQ